MTPQAYQGKDFLQELRELALRSLRPTTPMTTDKYRYRIDMIGNAIYNAFRVAEHERLPDGQLAAFVAVSLAMLADNLYDYVAINTKPAPILYSAPDSRLSAAEEMAEALRYLLDVREIKCGHSHADPDEICANCKARAALAKWEGSK